MSSTTIEMGELFSVAGPIYVSVGEGMFAYEARTEGAILGDADIGADIADNTKAWEIFLAAKGGDEKKAERFREPKELVGKAIMGQTCIRGKATKRNGLQFGTIVAYHDTEATTEAEIDELPEDEDDDEDDDEE
jgi:hypothetical protein